MNKIKEYAALVALCIGLGGCGYSLPFGQNPASACTDKDTTNTIFDMLRRDTGPSDTDTEKDEINKSIDYLISSGSIKFINILYQGQDKDNHKISCQATIDMEYTKPQLENQGRLIRGLAGNNSANLPNNEQTEISYTRQPSADGKSYIYTYALPENSSFSLGTYGLLHYAGTEDMAHDAATAASNQVNASSTESNDNAATSPNSAAGGDSNDVVNSTSQ
jgi:hypothetical protein